MIRYGYEFKESMNLGIVNSATALLMAEMGTVKEF